MVVTGRPRRPGARGAALRDALVAMVATGAGVAVGVAAVTQRVVVSPVTLLALGAIVAVGDLGTRVPLRMMARRTGAVGAVLAGAAVQVAVLWLALLLWVDIGISDIGTVLGVTVIAGVVMTLVRWVLGLNDSGYVVADVLRRARRHAGSGAPRSQQRPPGLLIVQLDGVASSVLDHARQAGLTPVMSRWVSSASHRLDGWWAQVPATTPASQAGMLHGAADSIPAFRWWDRALGRLVVTNHPDDAAVVEQRMSTGAGLLAGDGAAISAMFSGDAPESYLVMSRSRSHGVGSGAMYVRFFAGPFIFGRALLLTAAEMLKELYQARRQRVRQVMPRISRAGWYVVLRGVTNVLLRDLTTSLVAEQLMRGTATVFVDYVDYDEIAHHAGPVRPESLRSLEGLDRVVGILEAVASVAPRDYRLVVLSDHGQTLGSTFAQLAGRPFAAAVAELVEASDLTADTDDDADDSDAAAVRHPWRGHGGVGDRGAAMARLLHRRYADRDRGDGEHGPGERWGQVNTLLTQLLGRRSDEPPVVVGAQRHEDDARQDVRAGQGPQEPVVVASGNLALVWLPGAADRLLLEQIHARWPGLVAATAALPGVGVVVVDSAQHGLVAVGRSGIRLLERDVPLQGDDPMLQFGDRGVADLLRAARLPSTGDMLVVSSVDPDGTVHAFEHQVGSHGGLGGPQNDAVLLHPAELVVDDDLRQEVGDRSMLVGADAVHEQLLRWQRQLGLRPPAAAGTGPEDDE